MRVSSRTSRCSRCRGRRSRSTTGARAAGCTRRSAARQRRLRPRRAVLPQPRAELRRDAGAAHHQRPRLHGRRRVPLPDRAPPRRDRRARTCRTTTSPTATAHSYFVDHYTQFNRYFNFVADINEVSDDRYFEDFGDSLDHARRRATCSSSAYINGRGSWWSMAFGGDDLEVTDPRIARLVRAVPPPAALHVRREQAPATTGFEPAAQRVRRLRQGRRGHRHARSTSIPYVAFPFERAAWYVRPEFGVRHTSYDLDRDARRLAALAPTRTTDREPRRRPCSSTATSPGGDARCAQTLEPRLFYLYVPYEDQDDLPLFDTQELTFGFGQLFRTNRFSGADRQIDANQLTLALSSRLHRRRRRRELLRASIGQIRYFDDQDVQLPGRAADRLRRFRLRRRARPRAARALAR